MGVKRPLQVDEPQQVVHRRVHGEERDIPAIEPLIPSASFRQIHDEAFGVAMALKCVKIPGSDQCAGVLIDVSAAPARFQLQRSLKGKDDLMMGMGMGPDFCRVVPQFGLGNLRIH